MKNIFAALGKWFGAQTIAVKALSVVLAVGVVGTAGVAVYMAVDKEEAPAKSVVSSVEQSAADVEEVQESKPADSKQEQTADADTKTDAEDKDTAEDTVQTADTEETASPEEDENAGNADYVPYEKNSDKLVNGNFSDGLNGFDLYALEGAGMDYSVSSQGLAVTVYDTGTEDWHIQLKQGGIRLEQGKWYQLTMDAKSTLARTIGCALQKDGTDDGDWTPYSGSARMELGSNWETYTVTFQMNYATDAKTNFNISLGTVDGAHISSTHTVNIRNINLAVLPDNWLDGLKEGDNLIANGNFSYGDIMWDGSVVAPGAAKVSFKNNRAKFDISDTGTEDWHIQLKQTGIKIQKGHAYRFTFKVSSSAARNIKIGFMDTNYINWYGGGDVAVYPAEGIGMITFKSNFEDNDNVLLMISMGNPVGASTPASTITLSDLRLVEVPEYEAIKSNGGGAPTISLPDGWTLYDHENKQVLSAYNDGENGICINMSNSGSDSWHVQLQKKYVTLEQGKYYKVSYEVKASEERLVNYMMQHDGATDNNWNSYGPSEDGTFTVGNDWKSVENVFQMTAETDPAVIYNISLGMVNGQTVDHAHTVWFRNLNFEETEAPAPKEIGLNEEILQNTAFADNGAKWSIEIGADKGSYTLAENTVTFDIADVGANDWDVQLKQNGIKLEKDCKYRVTFKASSTAARKVQLGFLSTSYAWYGGSKLDFGTEEQEYTLEFTMNSDTDEAAYMGFSMGRMADDDGAPIETPASTIVLKDLSLMKIAEPDAPAPALLEQEVAFNVPFDFDWSQFVPGAKIGDVVELTMKVESEASNYSGGIGINTAAEENYWYQPSFGKDNNQVTAIFHVGADENGVMQTNVKVQYWWSEEESKPVTFKLLSAKKQTAALLVQEITYNVPYTFSWLQFVPDAQVGDVIVLTMKAESEASNYSGGIGINTGVEEGYWYQPNYSKDSNQVTATFHVGTDEQGVMKSDVQVQYWWSEEEDKPVTFTLISAEKQAAGSAQPLLEQEVVYGTPYEFNWLQFIPDAQIGDVVTLHVKSEYEVGDFNGAIGVNAGAEENYWYMPSFNQASGEFDITFHVGADEQGNMLSGGKVEVYWPQDGTAVKFSVLAASKQ